MRRFKELAGLIGDVLKVTDQRGAVFAGLQVLQQGGIIGKTFITAESQRRRVGQITWIDLNFARS
jgi:hypothetical protein